MVASVRPLFTFTSSCTHVLIQTPSSLLHSWPQAIEDVVVSKRRAQYEEALSTEALDYDTWFDYIRLEEAQVSCVGRGGKGSGPDRQEDRGSSQPASRSSLWSPLALQRVRSSARAHAPPHSLSLVDAGRPGSHPGGLRARHRPGAPRAREAVSAYRSRAARAWPVCTPSFNLSPPLPPISPPRASAAPCACI